MPVSFQSALYATESIAERQLRKRHSEKLIAACKAFAVVITPVLPDASVKCLTGKVIHQLSKYDPAFMHRTLQVNEGAR